MKCIFRLITAFAAALQAPGPGLALAASAECNVAATEVIGGVAETNTADVADKLACATWSTCGSSYAEEIRVSLFGLADFNDVGGLEGGKSGFPWR